MHGTIDTLFDILSASAIVGRHDQALEAWYASRPESVEPGDSLASIVEAQHFCNVSLWDLEDEARRRDVADEHIAKVKRKIDGWNQRRNDLVERIDEAVLAVLEDAPTDGAARHSETAGMMADRLSILSLKILHMRRYADDAADAELARECRDKEDVLRVQRADLAECLEALLREFRAGTRYYRLYRQYKAYNDPRLNPTTRDE